MHDKNLSLKQFRTPIFKAIALAYLFFPVVYLVFSSLLFEIPFSKLFSILLSPAFVWMTFWSVLAGYALWEMLQWGWYVFLVANVNIIYFNAVVVATYSESDQKAMALVFSYIILTIVFLRVARETRVPYFLPKIPWWEKDPANWFSVPVQITRANGAIHEGLMLDLSDLGCFIKFYYPMDINEEVHLSMDVFNHALWCKGRVVWCAKSTVTHPKGIGVKFFPLDRPNRKILKQILQEIQNGKKEGTPETIPNSIRNPLE